MTLKGDSVGAMSGLAGGCVWSIYVVKARVRSVNNAGLRRCGGLYEALKGRMLPTLFVVPGTGRR